MCDRQCGGSGYILYLPCACVGWERLLVSLIPSLHLSSSFEIFWRVGLDCFGLLRLSPLFCIRRTDSKQSRERARIWVGYLGPLDQPWIMSGRIIWLGLGNSMGHTQGLITSHGSYVLTMRRGGKTRARRNGRERIEWPWCLLFLKTIFGLRYPPSPPQCTFPFHDTPLHYCVL